MIGQKLADRYEILAELGRGGMGVVYLAHDPLLDREVAVKLVPPRQLTEESQERLLREAKLVAKMDHPVICPVYDLGRQDGALFFVMPVVRGTNLRNLIRAGAVDLGDVLEIGVQVARALEYSHSHGVLHRDVKPDNIMVPREEAKSLHVRVMDFGLAKASVHASLTSTRALVGTIKYISPEQVTKSELDQRSDIYSLGVVLYECLAGRPPFNGEVHSVLHQIVYDDPAPLSSAKYYVDPELEDVVLHCLAKDPNRRPQHALDVADGLARYRDTLNEQELKTTLAAPILGQRSYAPADIPLVGRAKDLSGLHEQLDSAKAGECQFVLLGGEEGVGKSRLLHEFEDQIQSQDIRILHGRFIEQQPGFPYHGFCELIQDYFRAKDTSSSSSAAADLSDLAGDLLSFFPVLMEISALRNRADIDTPAGFEAQKAEDKTYIFELLARTFARIASTRPLVIFLEDLHQSDIAVEALQYVVRRLGPTATLIVATYCSDEVDRRHPITDLLGAFRSDRHFRSLQLAPLSRSENRGLLSHLLGGVEIEDELADKIYETTDGNPFFTVDLVQSLSDFGVIMKSEDGSWHLSEHRDVSIDHLPATIQQAVDKRIRNLSTELQRVLLLASVLGKSFEFEHLEALTGPDVDVDEAVDKLLDAKILVEVRQSREDRIAFSSGVVRDVLYTGLTRRKRRQYHRKFAEYLEDHYRGRERRVSGLLLHHYSLADAPGPSIHYGLMTAHQALATFSPHDALRAAKVALDFLDDAGDEKDSATLGDAWLVTARSHRLAGNSHASLAAAEHAATAFQAATEAERAAEAFLLAAEVAWESQQTGPAERWVENGIQIAKESDQGENHQRLLSLGITLANLQGHQDQARRYHTILSELREADQASGEISLGGSLVVGLSASIYAPDPALVRTVEEVEVYANCFETLLATDSEGNLEPLLCESWHAIDGGRAFELQLRDDVRFHDGTPLTASAVKRSFERAIQCTATRETQGAARTLLESIAGVEPVEAVGAAGLIAAQAAEGGLQDRVERDAPSVDGIVVVNEHRLRIDLKEPLPIFPVLLTQPQTVVVREAVEDSPPLVGTGPFRIVHYEPNRVTLHKNDAYWRPKRPRLDELEFRAGLSSGETAEALRSGQIELAHDLLPEDLERVLRDPRFRSGLVEVAEKSTYFAVFNVSSPVVTNPVLREVLAGSLRIHDLVWRTLGRFAQPATGLIPPGILGHHPGRRHPAGLSPNEARDRLRGEGIEAVSLRAAVHPVFLDRYRSLLNSIIAAWRELGVDLELVNSTVEEFLDLFENNEGIDLWVGRYFADYDDADNFVYGLFHSQIGLLRKYLSSAEFDELAERARTEGDPSVRHALYLRIEKLMGTSSSLIPLFHEVRYRVASPEVKRLRLQTIPPYVNYSQVVKSDASERHQPPALTSDILEIPIVGKVRSLDPAVCRSLADFEVVPNVYETLTRVIEGAHVVPWLARKIEVGGGGKGVDVHLRDDVHFHNGRRLTVRDVRYSFERLLRAGGYGAQILQPIRGAAAVIGGEATELDGFHVVSATQFRLELIRPTYILPILLSHPTTAIIPESTDSPSGTGPFRPTQFLPGRRLELEANLEYWRKGGPGVSRLVFLFDVSPGETLKGFRTGRFSVAAGLDQSGVEKLRTDSGFAKGCRESPGLTTAFVHFNSRRGPLEDIELRRRLYHAVDVPALVRRTVPFQTVVAPSLVPAALLGDQPATTQPHAKVYSADSMAAKHTLTAAVLPSPAIYPKVARELFRMFRKLGIRVNIVNDDVAGFFAAMEAGSVDLVVGRWCAQYPDPDSFFYQLYDPTTGVLRHFYGSKKASDLIDAGRAEKDAFIRRSVYFEFLSMLSNDAALVPLFNEPECRFGQPWLEGLKISFSYPTVPYDELSRRN